MGPSFLEDEEGVVLRRSTDEDRAWRKLTTDGPGRLGRLCLVTQKASSDAMVGGPGPRLILIRVSATRCHDA